MTKMSDTPCITVNMICASMPFQKVTKFKNERIYSEMAVVCKEIYHNLVAITLLYGHGQAVFIGILMPKAMYI